MKHPALLQFRGDISKVRGHVRKLNGVEVVENKYGMDVYFEDVNDARRFLSRIRKIVRAEIKSSTKYAGLRKGRVRWFFTYSVRIRDEG